MTTLLVPVLAGVALAATEPRGDRCAFDGLWSLQAVSVEVVGGPGCNSMVKRPIVEIEAWGRSEGGELIWTSRDVDGDLQMRGIYNTTTCTGFATGTGADKHGGALHMQWLRVNGTRVEGKLYTMLDPGERKREKLCWFEWRIYGQRQQSTTRAGER